MTIACNDCFWEALRRDGPACEHPQCFISVTDYETGKPYMTQYSLNAMRTVGPCKPAALLFQPRTAITGRSIGR